MDPSRIWSSACSRVPSNFLSAGLMRASRSLQSTPKRTQGYPQKTETQVPTHQNFIPQWSTTVLLLVPIQGRAALNANGLSAAVKMQSFLSLDPYLACSSWPGAKEALLGTDSPWKPTGGAHPSRPARTLTSFPEGCGDLPRLARGGCWLGPLLPVDRGALPRGLAKCCGLSFGRVLKSSKRRPH